MTRIFLILPLLAIAVAASSAEETRRIHPEQPPLAVLRIGKPAAVEDFFETRQALGLGQRNADYSGSLPGLNIKLRSFRSFMQALAENRADTFWYCLSQSGGTIMNLSAAFGCDWLTAEKDYSPQVVRAWLNDNAFQADRLAIETRRVDDRRLACAVAGQQTTIDAVVRGGKRASGAGDRWRHRLDAFMADESEALGLWLNPRPLLGVTALTTGVDLRTIGARYGVAVPESIELAVKRDDEYLGFDLRLNRVLDRTGSDPEADPDIEIPGQRENAFADLTLGSLPALLARLNVETNPLAPAGIDLSALLPRVVKATATFDNPDVPSWRAAALLRDKEAFMRQFRRLEAWLELLANSPASGLSVARDASQAGGDVLRLSFADGVELFAQIADNGRGDAFLLLAGRRDDIPDAKTYVVRQPGSANTLSWDIRLDDAAAEAAMSALGPKLRRLGISGTDGDFLAALPRSEQGFVRLDGDSVVISSPHALAPCLGAAWGEKLAGIIASRSKSTDALVCARLRFLLDASSQSRYRQIAPGRLDAAPLPSDIGALSPADAAGRAWLDYALPPFPGYGGPNSSALSGLAAGRALDGFIYRIDDGGNGGWHIAAESTAGIVYRIDFQGVVEKRSGSGEWRRVGAW